MTMEIILKGFEDWAIDTAHTNQGKRWVDIYKKKNASGENLENWEQFGSFNDLGEALDCMLEEGLCMTEDQVCQAQDSCY